MGVKPGQGHVEQLIGRGGGGLHEVVVHPLPGGGATRGLRFVRAHIIERNRQEGRGLEHGVVGQRGAKLRPQGYQVGRRVFSGQVAQLLDQARTQHRG